MDLKPEELLENTLTPHISDEDRLNYLSNQNTGSTTSKEEVPETDNVQNQNVQNQNVQNQEEEPKLSKEQLQAKVKELNAQGEHHWFIHDGRIARRSTNKEVIEKLKNPLKIFQGAAQDIAATEPKWYKPQAYLSAAGAGYVDSAIGLVNLVPGVNIPHLPQYENDSLQATRDIASLVIPTMQLSKFGNKKFIDFATSKGWNIAKKDKWVRWLSRAVIGGTAGAIVDTAAPVQERDHNMGGWLKTTWPNTYSWYPQSWATLDSDSPEVKRQKNRNEGIGFGFSIDLIPAVGRLFRSRKGIKEATQWLPQNEVGRNWLAKKNKVVKLSDEPLENDVLKSLKKRDDELIELGQSKFDDPWLDTSVPTKGVHDLFDHTENGIRATDDGGIVAAGVDQARIVKNIDTRYGRIGNFISAKNLNDLITGKQKPLEFFKKLGKVLRETDVNYKGRNGKTVRHADSLLEAEKLAAELYDTDLEGMKNILRPLSTVDPTTGTRTLTGKAYKAVMQAIKKYSDDFINMDLARAEGLAATSTGGQVSDLAEGARYMGRHSPAIEAAYDQILDRLELLMNLEGQTNLTRRKSFNIADIVNGLKKKGSLLNPTEAARAIKDESNSTLDALESIANETRQTIETLREVKKARPKLLSPLMLAYEVTDGRVKSIAALNRYVRNSTGVLSKAVIDANPEMPSAFTQGMWANIYNSILSAIGTPLKAALSNTVLMVERPLATFAGALAHKDWATLRRAHYMYNVGIGETTQRAFSHMAQIWRSAAVDPNSVGYIMRDDIARKNAGQVEIMRTFSDAAAQEGQYGPSVMTNYVEALNDMSEHPLLRMGANAMTAFDGFTRSWVGNVEARGRAYDAIMNNNGRVTEKRVRAMARNVYGQMFDDTGMITDRAVEYASKEIAMNLDNPLVTSLNELIKHVPATKPFLMFPKTSINMMRFAGSHNPIGAFADQLNAFQLPFEKMPIDDVKRLLTERGVSTNPDTIEAAYDTIRAELKGRKAIGTMSVLGAAGLFMSDRITGNGLYDKTRQRVRRELGWTPKSIKGLDGRWYSYENLGPITDWLALTADIMDNFDTLDAPHLEVLLQKSAFLLSANLTDKSFTAGLEPLGDVLSGNVAAMQRWAGTFGSALVPLSGLRNEFARLISPQLKEVEQELSDIIANRNPILKEQLPDLYDWMDGSKVKEPLNFFTRVWNTYSPLWKVSEAISPEKQFLIDIEFDGRPTLTTNGQGVEYSTEQRSEITRLMGESGEFARAVRNIMQTTSAKEFRKAFELAQRQGVAIDRTQFLGLYLDLKDALTIAKENAEHKSSEFEDILNKQELNYDIREATRSGDIEQILRLQKGY